MECTIPASGVKVLGKAIHCFSKLGEDLFFEATADELALRTVSLSKSAYACLGLHPEFFDRYSVPCLATSTSNGAENALRCKISSKCCLAVFRSLQHVEKQVVSCDILLDTDSSFITFRLLCKHGIVKTHQVYFEECDTLQAVYDRSACPNELICSSSILSETMINFQTGLEEITLSLSQEKLQISNYVEQAADNEVPVLQTKLSVDRSEFSFFQTNGKDVSLTFCLKELKALLSFADTVGDITINCGDAGRPIIFHTHGPGFFCDFVLATLKEPEPSQDKQMTGTPSEVDPIRATPMNQQQGMQTPVRPPARPSQQDPVSASSATTAERHQPRVSSAARQHRQTGRQTPNTLPRAGLLSSFDDEHANSSPNLSLSVGPTGQASGARHRGLHASQDVTMAPVSAARNAYSPDHRNLADTNDQNDTDGEDDDADDDDVQGTPPRGKKRFKSMLVDSQPGMPRALQ